VFLIYVDESGDTGPFPPSPTQHFALSGFVLHELSWLKALDDVLAFRRAVRTGYGIKVRQEIHASPLLNNPHPLPKHRRLHLLREVLDFEAQTFAGIANVINVVVDKQGKAPTYDVFDNAWRALIQRFHDTIMHRNFPGPQNAADKGLLVADDGQTTKLRKLSRRMRRFNPVASKINAGSRQIPTDTVVEDPVHRDSAESFFVQLADVNAYFLLQESRPNQFVKRKGARNWIHRLAPILCRKASSSDPFGIVRL